MILELTLIVLALFGHLALWVMLYNRLHAINLSRPAVKRWERTTIFPCVLLMFPVVLTVWWFSQPGGWPHRLALTYAQICWAAFLIALGTWTVRRLFRTHHEASLISNHTQWTDVAKISDAPLVSPGVKWFARLPRNQILTFQTHYETLQIPRLPEALEGLKIAHLSDLHFCGRILPEYFRHLVQQVNDWSPDVVAITGDIVDKTDCIPWIRETLGPLNADAQRLYVLGNHDKRVIDVNHVRHELTDLGWIDASSGCHTITIADCPIVVCGNELPWFGPPSCMDDAPPPTRDGGPFRLALLHTPDQFRWAIGHEFDLALAGHVHGGQIRFPIIGAVVCPSRYGVKYACGVFQGKDTVMHVSRGVSGLYPLRFHCPPELALITLTRHSA